MLPHQTSYRVIYGDTDNMVIADHACLDLTGRVVRPPHFLKKLFHLKKNTKGTADNKKNLSPVGHGQPFPGLATVTEA